MQQAQCLACKKTMDVDLGGFFKSEKHSGKYFFCCDVCTDKIKDFSQAFWSEKGLVRFAA